MKRIAPILLALLLSSAAAAQTPVFGWRDFSFPNTTGSGSSQLATRVYYPSTQTGNNVPIKPRAGGHPVIVMLHGFAAIGNFYSELGSYFADQGYVVALPNTAQFSAVTQVRDALALFPALTAANGQPNGFLNGALDMNRVGLTGHSMGGGSTFNVLANNPGFRCGIGIAPVDASATVNNITVPIGILHGKGDTVLPWQSNALSTFNAAGSYDQLKFLYLMTSACDHTNVAGLFLTSQSARDVWARCALVLQGFFDRYLEGEADGLEEAVGTAARASAVLDTLYVETKTPSIWFRGTPDLGATVRPTLLCEPGPALIATSVLTVSIPVSFGLLRLDPATLTLVTQGNTGTSRLLAPPLTIPNNPALRGANFPLQGLGLDDTGSLRLSGLVTLTVN